MSPADGAAFQPGTRITPAGVAFVPPVEQSDHFSPVGPAHRPAWPAFGPGSNTGQNSQIAARVSQLLFDFCSVVVQPGALKKSGCRDYRQLLDWIFGTGNQVVMCSIQNKFFQFYPQSATLLDQTETVCGKVGFAEDGSILFSLSGQGCQYVSDWRRTHDRLCLLDGKLTRVDIACDDLEGAMFNVRSLLDAYNAGEFTSKGRPPGGRLIDDLGSGKGCTLYIGQKGHKELCAYERDKMLGDPEGKTVRLELRLYAKHVDLPLAVLLDPERFFRGAYPYLANFLAGELQRLEVREHYANVTAEAQLKFQRTQTGTGVGLILRAMKGHTAAETLAALERYVARHDGLPGRFKGYTGDPEKLMRILLTNDDDEREDHGEDHDSGPGG